MELKLYSSESLPDHVEAWQRSAISTSQADPFCSCPAWQMAFHDAFAPGRRLMVEAASNSLIALAEHQVSVHETFLTPIEPHWFFGCPLLGKDGVAMLANMLPDIEKLYAPTFPKIILSGIRPGGRLSRRLIAHFAPRFDIFLIDAGVQGAASLKDGVDGYLSRRSANHRKKLRKQTRRAAETGVYYERVLPTSREETEAAYSRIIAVELKSWKGIEKCGMAETPSKEFYDFLLKRLVARKAGRIIFARHENTDIGFIFGGLAGKIYRGQQFSYDDTWKDFSIGNLMQMEKIKWLCEENIKRYDMGPVSGPKMGYKTHWTEKRLPIQTWLLVRR